ncbi:hypothetical protein B0T21DRAFT_10894 [Apiosordaria backusii]|uniref:Uncharacterized protein n=1 Tax=Apiosordaria backusii TaxID=314023 RepID=A0AA40K6H7_9PEZI|nr:hypothetical protein B0T21DRAFT_10894 [Apiosordaria backusii]
MQLHGERRRVGGGCWTSRLGRPIARNAETKHNTALLRRNDRFCVPDHEDGRGGGALEAWEHAWFPRDSLKCCAARRLRINGRQLATASDAEDINKNKLPPFGGLDIFQYLPPIFYSVMEACVDVSNTLVGLSARSCLGLPVSGPGPCFTTPTQNPDTAILTIVRRQLAACEGLRNGTSKPGLCMLASRPLSYRGCPAAREAYRVTMQVDKWMTSRLS